jgi:hypothetical protein
MMHAAGDIAIEGQQFVAAGRLRGATLLPKKAAITKVKSHTVDGKEYAPSKTAEFDVPGQWRVEVEGGNLFLHVLSTEPLAAALVEKGDEVGVDVGGRRFLFKKAGVSRAVSVK